VTWVKIGAMNFGVCKIKKFLARSGAFLVTEYNKVSQTIRELYCKKFLEFLDYMLEATVFTSE
jgi:hypothetical protein